MNRVGRIHLTQLERLGVTWTKSPEQEEHEREIPDPAGQAAKDAGVKLVRKVYEVDPLPGQKGGTQMRVIALIEDPAVIERILSWLGLWEPLRVSAPSPPAERPSLPLTYHPVPDIA